VRRERLAGLASRLVAATEAELAAQRSRLALAAGRLDSLSPLAVLGRGYAIARRADDGRIVRRASEVAPGDEIALRLARGTLSARVTGVSDD